MMQDVLQDIQNDISIEIDLAKGLHDLTFKEDIQNLTGALVPSPEAPKALEAPERKSRTEDAEDDTSEPQYKVTEQEHRLQEEETKYKIYMNTFRYEGDDSNLDSKTDTDSNVTTYPYLDKIQS